LEETIVTTPKQSNTDWVRCYYDAFNRRDWEWISAMLAPDVEWLHASRDERVRGTNAVIASFRSLVEGTPSAHIEVRAVHDAGLVVIAECGIRHVQKRTSVPPPLRGTSSSNRPPPIERPSFCEVLEIKAGRCSRGTTYADSVRLLMDINQAASAAA
jgi:ketosteroid isomerase-like protein